MLERQGFTLLELLVVMAILGILFGLVTFGYAGFVQSSRVKETSVFVAQRLVRAQTQAKRENRRWSFQVTGAGTFRTGPVAGTLANISLPEGTQFSAATVSAAATVNYDPPYGARSGYQTNGTAVSSFVIQATANTSKTRTVKVVSLLGQVVIQ